MRVFNVRLFRAILVAATLALWLAGANHCRIEQLPGMEFLACAPIDCAQGGHGEASECDGHEDAGCPEDSCAGDSCATVEGALFQAGYLRIKAEVPLSFSVCFVAAIWFGVFDAEPSPVSLFPLPASPPPESARLWQFSQRAAASPRAPSPLA